MTFHISNHAARIAQGFSALFLAAALAACAGPAGRAQPVQESAPSVTYKFTDDEGLVDATVKAEAYCREYNALPTTSVIRQAPDGAREVVFVCDQARAVAFADTRTMHRTATPTVQYTYRDERTLIEATTEAQRHCAALGAEARSHTVSTGPAGTRTVVFECVPVQ
jgi:hypothetical protein